MGEVVHASWPWHSLVVLHEMFNQTIVGREPKF